MTSTVLFILAGVFEIGGGYLVWIWLREGRSIWLGVVGFFLLAIYGIVPVFQPKTDPFGRVYAAYGGVFIILSVLWSWSIDAKRPDTRDLLGAAVCLAGVVLMMWPRKP